MSKLNSPSAPHDDSDIVFLSGNPNVEITEGIVHFYKDKHSLTSLDSNTLPSLICMLSVPAYLQLRDILHFIEGVQEDIEELKIVRDGKPNSYMTFLKFVSSEKALNFFNCYNGVKYTSMDEDCCQLAFISHIEAVCSSVGGMFPIKDLIELPSCSVCLERLDEPVQGILTTVLCNHSFHDRCLAQMKELTCPICRYVQSPEMVGDSACADCDLRENLWICLICGNVGCGRYGKKHAYKHFTTTGHIFALELGQNLVWDYVDDAYVHRLVVNQDDGKVVQLGASSETGDKKLDAISMEYSAVLINQLESQRHHFETQIERITQHTHETVSRLEESNKMAMSKIESLEQSLAEVNKKHLLNQKKLETKELEEERAVAKSTLVVQTEWKQRAEENEIRIKELEEELNDLMVNLQFRDKLEEVKKSEQ
ncbi:hypothetical protein Ciccas_011250, partial [Cichlidogyrus casuarinus]